MGHASATAATSAKKSGKEKPQNEEVLSGFVQFTAEPRAILKSKLQMRFLSLSLVLSIAFVGFGFYNYMTRAAGRTADVYFELKAINSEGHPVAGANVFLEKTHLGVTDSFGEWRRFMRVKLGTSLMFKMTARMGHSHLSALKNLVVPIRAPAKGEIELLRTIQLGEVARVEVAKSKVKVREVKPEAKLEVVEASPATQLSPQKEAGLDLTRVNFTVATNGPYLNKIVMPLLKREASRRGLVIDQNSPWQVSLSHVVIGDGKSLVRVQSNLQTQTGLKQDEFLQNYLADTTELSQKIFKMLKANAPKTFQILHDETGWYALQPDVAKGFWSLKEGDQLVDRNGSAYSVGAPHNVGSFRGMALIGAQDKICKKSLEANQTCYMKTLTLDDWQGVRGDIRTENLVKSRIQLLGDLDSNDRVFVGGLQAKASGGQIWEFFAKPNKNTNVTIIRDGRVIWRQKLFNSPHHMPVVSLQTMRIARG